MSEAVKDALRRAAPLDTAEPPLPAIVRRGRHLVRRRYALVITGVAVAATLGPLGVMRLIDAATGTVAETRPGGQRPLPTSIPAPENVAEIALPGSPVGVVATETDAWVAHSDGSGGFVLSRVSAATNEVVDEIPLAGIPAAVEYRAPFVWLLVKEGTTGGDVVRVDAASGRVDKGLVEVAFEPLDMAIGPETGWITSVAGQVYEIDRDQKGVPRPLDASGDFVASDGDDAWAATIEGAIVRLDAGGGADVLADVGPNVIRLEVTHRHLWIAQQLPDGGLEVSKLLRSDGGVSGRPAAFPPGPADVFATPSGAWVALSGLAGLSEKGSVVWVPADERESQVEVEVGKGPISVAVAGDDLWVANFGSATLSRLSLGGE